MKTNNNLINYQPVSCEMHSELELAIMRAQRLKIYYLNGIDKKQLQADITPHDVVTRGNKTNHITAQDNGEFLLASDNNGNTLEIRLDLILKYHLQTS